MLLLIVIIAWLLSKKRKLGQPHVLFLGSFQILNIIILLVCLFLFICSIQLGAANELHDQFSVTVTDWEKFGVFIRYFKNSKYSGKIHGYNHQAIVNEMVFKL
jgi:hypothetical protein